MPDDKDNCRKANLCIYIGERNDSLAMVNCFHMKLEEKKSELWELSPKYITEIELATMKVYFKGQPLIYKAIVPKFP